MRMSRQSCGTNGSELKLFRMAIEREKSIALKSDLSLTGSAIEEFLRYVLRSIFALPTSQQLVEATQDKCLPPVGMLDVVQLQAWQAAQQGRNRDLCLNAGKLSADAVVNAAAERQGANVASRD